MILVNFKGYGEWFIRDGNSIKLAIVRRTNNPFEDPQEWKPPKPYGPYTDECPYPDDDNEESPYNQQLSFPDRDREFDRDLRGIFMRDPNVKGKIYDTNGLRCFGADYMICGRYPVHGFYPFRGVFRLTDEDEEDFRLASFDPKSDDWDKFKDRVKILKPCTHPSSLFSKMVNEGTLTADIENDVYFEIQKKLYLNFHEAPKEECVSYILDFVDIDISESVSAPFPVIVNNNTPRNTDLQEIIRAALNNMKSNYGEAPAAIAVSSYILSKVFQHSCIVDKTEREMKLIGGKKYDSNQIRNAYRRTTLKNLNKSNI